MDLWLRSFSFAATALFVCAQILETKDGESHKQVNTQFLQFWTFYLNDAIF